MPAAGVALVALASLAGDVDVNGFLSTRAQFTAPSSSSALSTRERPILSDLNEANVQARARFLDEKLRVGADLSLFLQLAGGYADADADSGALRSVDWEALDLDEPDVARAFVSLAELWVSAEPIEHLVLTAGKKRTVWGSGLAYSPTDLLNPARDPTDPSLQRAGFWHARVDVPFETFSLTALFAPAVLEEQASVPTRLLVDERLDRTSSDDTLRYAGALRAYALVGEADINAWLLWTNEYGDAFENKPRLALTLSQSLFTIHEFHAEVLLQQGSARFTVDPDCAVAPETLVGCALAGRPFVNDELLDSDFVYPDLLVGWRVMPEDGSMLSVEYLYQADGFLRAEYDDVARLLSFLGDFQRSGLDVPLSGVGGSGPSSNATSATGIPTRVAFNPLRRHYLFLTYTKPQVLDDFTLSSTLITPIEDLSMLLTGSVAWQAQEWLSLSLFGFVPLPSPARASRDIEGDPWQALYEATPEEVRGWVPRGALVKGVPTGEFDMAPFDAIVMLEARAFF